MAAKDNPVPLEIVVAVGRNGAIGRGNALPWRMPGDLARFKALTMGKPMVMGRRTYDAIGRPLPGRESIVVSRAAGPTPAPGLHHAADLDAALDLAIACAKTMGADAVALIGGATLFDALIGRADRLRTTIVDLSPEADTFFPPIDPYVWREASRHRPAPHPDDEADCVFVDYVRD